MELLILDLWNAIDYAPENRTYAIRIYSEYALDHLESLVESDNWLHIAQYVFDDVWPGMFGGLARKHILMDEGLAGRILTEFNDHRAQAETLLVHCSRGQNRSPAVGIAMNEIFSLGHDTDSLKEQYPESNWYVYETLLKAAENIDLQDPKTQDSSV